MATVKEGPPPLSVSPSAQAVIDGATTAGFKQLGWLTATMDTIMPLAAFVSDDGGRKVTTTTNPIAFGQPERGIYKFSHRGASVAELLDLHLAHIEELDGEVEQFVTTLDELAQSIVDYLALERAVD